MHLHTAAAKHPQAYHDTRTRRALQSASFFLRHPSLTLSKPGTYSRVPLELEKLGRVIAYYRTLSRVIASYLETSTGGRAGARWVVGRASCKSKCMGGRCRTPGAREGTVHFFVMDGQWRDTASARASSASHSRLGPIASEFRVGAWTVSLAIGSRCASGLRHHPRGKMLSAFVRATAASLAKSFVDRLPSVAPRQGVMRPASRRTASLIAKRGWINAMDRPTRCLGLCVAFASCAAASTSTRELPSGT